ncbi:hypothetical protein HMPREF1376_01496 [Enterococcus faecium R446]|nr:hypothetical protein HMPREF1376_01496 [Enterococcus faecium R446]
MRIQPEPLRTKYRKGLLKQTEVPFFCSLWRSIMNQKPVE